MIQPLKNKKREFFRNFCDGDLPGTSLLRNTLIMIHLRALAHRIYVFLFWNIALPGTSLLCNILIMIHLRALAHRIYVFLFWNIAFILFLWRHYVLDESGMRKDLCLFTKSFALWWMTQPAFSQCIISCPLFHDPFGTFYVPAPDQPGVWGGCIPRAIQSVCVDYWDFAHLAPRIFCLPLPETRSPSLGHSPVLRGHWRILSKKE